MASGKLPKLLAGINGVSVGEANGRLAWLLTYLGETKSVDEWSAQFGVNRHTLLDRIQRGWSFERAFGTPARFERHGKKDIPEYRIWAAMLQRCLNENNSAYPDYGGRGIKPCERWLKFSAFFADMGRRPSPQHTLDRVDNNKGYEPGNVVWATMHTQTRNKRSNIWLTFAGRTMILVDWAREVGLPRKTLTNRLFTLGWTVERALTTPRRSGSR